MPLVQCQMCVGLSPQQAILQHYRGILQFTLILTLCIFLNVLSGAKFKGSVPGDATGFTCQFQAVDPQITLNFCMTWL